VVNGTHGETLTLSGNSNVANKTVGVNKGFNGVGDMTLGDLAGSLASNYVIGTSTLDITPLAITGAITADGKIYDATTAATTHGVLTGVIGSDVVTFTTSGLFDTKNVGNGKTVTVNGALSGGDAGNYTFTANATTTADVTPRTIVVGASADNKV